jgi:hypothetical protein
MKIESEEEVKARSAITSDEVIRKKQEKYQNRRLSGC